jgi:hypothetical protein
MLAIACSSHAPSAVQQKTDALQCGPDLQAKTAKKGASVLNAPDPFAPVITFLGDDTPVCIDPKAQGQNFHLVKLPSGTQGYMDEISFFKS